MILFSSQLQASPERATPAQLSEFQTEILVSLMEKLLAGDVLLDRESAMPIAAGGSFNNQVQNVFYLCSRVVDKMWQGKKGMLHLCPIHPRGRGGGGEELSNSFRNSLSSVQHFGSIYYRNFMWKCMVG